MSDSPETIDPAHSALLVMDYQAGIVARMGNLDALLLRMAAVIATARNQRMQVGYVRVAFADADYAAIPPTNRGFSTLVQGRMMHADSPDTAIVASLAPVAGDIIVRKTRVGAFSTTDLDRQLRDRGIDTLILAGISTSGVVLSTVRAGSDLDYRLIVLADCCMDPEPGVHEFLTARLFPRQATVLDSAALTELTHG